MQYNVRFSCAARLLLPSAGPGSGRLDLGPGKDPVRRALEVLIEARSGKRSRHSSRKGSKRGRKDKDRDRGRKKTRKKTRKKSLH